MQMKGCPRQRLCAFYHRRSEHRKQTSPDNHDYDHPLPAEVIDAAWADQFLNPPIFDNLDDEAVLVPTLLVKLSRPTPA
eukprot:s1944_g8.t1